MRMTSARRTSRGVCLRRKKGRINITRSRSFQIINGRSPIATSDNGRRTNGPRRSEVAETSLRGSRRGQHYMVYYLHVNSYCAIRFNVQTRNPNPFRCAASVDGRNVNSSPNQKSRPFFPGLRANRDSAGSDLSSGGRDGSDS